MLKLVLTFNNLSMLNYYRSWPLEQLYEVHTFPIFIVQIVFQDADITPYSEKKYAAVIYSEQLHYMNVSSGY